MTCNNMLDASQCSQTKRWLRKNRLFIPTGEKHGVQAKDKDLSRKLDQLSAGMDMVNSNWLFSYQRDSNQPVISFKPQSFEFAGIESQDDRHRRGNRKK